MATIASLNVNLGMNTAKFSAGAKKSTNDLKSLASSSNFTAIASGITAGVAASQAVISTASHYASALRDMVLEQVELVDAADELAQSLGTDVTQLSRLQFATEQTGGSAEALASSLQKMNVNLGKAAGGGAAAKPIEKLGLNIQALLDLDPAKRFEEIAERIRGIDNDAEQAAAAQAIFGKSAAGIINTIRAGKTTLQSFQEQSDLIGNTISAIDAEKLGQIDNEMKKLEASMSGAARTLSTELAPAIIDNLNLATAAIVEARKQLESLRNTSVADSTLSGLKVLNQLFNPVGIGELVTSAGELAERTSVTAENLKTVQTNAAGASKSFNDMLDNADDFEKLIDKLTADIEHFGLEGVRRDIAELGGTPEQIAQLTELADQIEQLSAAAKEREAAEQAIKEVVENTISPLDEYFAKLEKINKAIEAGRLSAEQTAFAHEKARDELEKAQAAIDEANKSPLQKRAEDRIKELQTPEQIFAGAGRQIREELEAGLLTLDQAELARLLNVKELESSLPEDEADTGAQRPAALERGTAAAFSASFGPVAKPMDRLARLTEQILAVQKRIDEKLGGTVSLSP